MCEIFTFFHFHFTALKTNWRNRAPHKCAIVTTLVIPRKSQSKECTKTLKKKKKMSSSAATSISGDVVAVLAAAVADMTNTGNDTGSDSGGDSDDGRDSDRSATSGRVQPSHSQVVVGEAEAEARRQKVLNLARMRVGGGSGSGGSDSPAVPDTVIWSQSDEEDPSSDVSNSDKVQEKKETMAPQPQLPLSKDRVERSIEEIKAKMTMSQEDSDDDDDEEEEAKEDEKDEEKVKDQKLGDFRHASESEVRIGVAANGPSDADDITHTSIKSSKKKTPSTGLTINIPFDERPPELPDDVPSFDAGEDWEGSSRRPPSPPVPLPPVSPRAAAASRPLAAPTNATSKDKHFFGTKKHKETGAALEARQPPTMPPNPDYGASAVPTAQSTSYEDSDADDWAASQSSKINERQSKHRSSTTASSGSRRRRRRNRSSSRHNTRRSSRKSRAKTTRKRPESALSDGDLTRSTVSFAETSSNHGVGGSKGILEACDPRVNSPKSSLILEFEDQDLIGWIMNGEACTSLHQKCGGMDDYVVRSHRVQQVTSDDDDMSDISNLTGRWRRSRLLVQEQQRRKAEEEAKRHTTTTGSPFDFMSMFCGDIKALFGLAPDEASF